MNENKDLSAFGQIKKAQRGERVSPEFARALEKFRKACEAAGTVTIEHNGESIEISREEEEWKQ